MNFPQTTLYSQKCTGETASVEYPVDRNLPTLAELDANAQVGHGILLWKYPMLLEMYADRHDEVSLLSSIILG